jgi:hypothetical protein
MLSQLYPEYQWLPWRFTPVPLGFWDNVKNQRTVIEWLGKQLQFQNWEDWYQVSTQRILDAGNRTVLIHYYSSSPSAMVEALFPEYRWLPWKFLHAPRSFWEDTKNQQTAIQFLAQELGITQWDGWHDITVTQVPHSYKGLLREFDFSLSRALLTLYPPSPDRNYQPWMLKGGLPPPYFWKRRSNLRAYFDWLIKEHHLLSPVDLATKPAAFFRKIYGDGTAAAPDLSNRANLLEALNIAFTGRLLFGNTTVTEIPFPFLL